MLSDAVYLNLDQKLSALDELRAQHRRSPGLYVVKSTHSDHTDVHRFGKKEDCVFSRIKHHNGVRFSFDNISGDLMPYEPLCAWLLPGWPPFRVAMAELAMIGALDAQGVDEFVSTQRMKKSDKSNYLIARQFDWQAFTQRVDAELAALKELGE